MNKPLILGICKVSFHHEYEPKTIVNSKKGLTEVVFNPKATNVVIETPNELVNARVSCDSRNAFIFETGRKKALKKAFAKTTLLTKEERRHTWEEYNKLKPGGRW